MLRGSDLGFPDVLSGSMAPVAVGRAFAMSSGRAQIGTVQMARIFVLLVPVFVSQVLAAAVSSQDSVSRKPDNIRIQKLIKALRPEEKIALVHGEFYAGTQDFAGFIAPSARLGIPAVQLADGEAWVPRSSLLNMLAKSKKWCQCRARHDGYSKPIECGSDMVKKASVRCWRGRRP